ncbi:hypothetical protein BX666DRAFT_1578241 [Dichotomocladium elegans]|nr:hypothetical protein BX666DRAFT_1578241 [Dichotomocladium elegans]
MGLQVKHKSIVRIIGENINDDLVDWTETKQKELYQLRLAAVDTRMRLSRHVDHYVRASKWNMCTCSLVAYKSHRQATLEILDIVWLILKEFKCHLEEEKNKTFDIYYCTLAESLLLSIKMLHITTLMTTYDPQLTDALKSLRSILQARFNDTRTQLSFVQKRILDYQDLGADFVTLVNSYSTVLRDIQATEEDIGRIRLHQP